MEFARNPLPLLFLGGDNLPGQVAQPFAAGLHLGKEASVLQGRGRLAGQGLGHQAPALAEVTRLAFGDGAQADDLLAGPQGDAQPTAELVGLPGQRPPIGLERRVGNVPAVMLAQGGLKVGLVGRVQDAIEESAAFVAAEGLETQPRRPFHQQEGGRVVAN